MRLQTSLFLSRLCRLTTSVPFTAPTTHYLISKPVEGIWWLSLHCVAKLPYPLAQVTLLVSTRCKVSLIPSALSYRELGWMCWLFHRVLLQPTSGNVL